MRIKNKVSARNGARELELEREPFIYRWPYLSNELLRVGTVRDVIVREIRRLILDDYMQSRLTSDTADTARTPRIGGNSLEFSDTYRESYTNGRAH